MDHASIYTGRLAPSPTGALHLGNARTFMIAWLRARSAGGEVIMRMEDLDHPRDKPGAAADAVADLRWLGFDWDREFVQSARRDVYHGAIAKLVDKGLAYPCTCSRRDVESAQSAPHDGEQLRYPGICRGRWRDWSAAASAIAPRIPCWRFRVEPGTRVEFEDGFAGLCSMDVGACLGDFPLARDPDGAGYTLAAAVDDCLMGVSEVVRGDDLIKATPAQILVERALGFEPPSFFHVPLVVAADGRRLAKRHGDTRIASCRAAGLSPERVIGLLAWWSGLAEYGEEVRLADLVARFDPSALPHAPAVLDDRARALLGDFAAAIPDPAPVKHQNRG